MSSPASPLSRALRLIGRALRPLFLGLLAVLLAVARGLAGPRYKPPHQPQNPPTELERKR